MSRIRIWILFLLVCCGACAVPIRDAAVPSAGEPRKTIYLVSHGWRADMPDSARLEPGVCAVESIPTAKAPQRSIFLFFFVA